MTGTTGTSLVIKRNEAPSAYLALTSCRGRSLNIKLRRLERLNYDGLRVQKIGMLALFHVEILPTIPVAGESGCWLRFMRAKQRHPLLNDDEPYFVRGDDGSIYKVEWYGGSSLFSEGDEVILTINYGMGKMVDDTSDETADVWVEEVSERYRLPALRPRPRPPNLTPASPTPYYLTPAPSGSPGKSADLKEFVKGFIEASNADNPSLEISFYADKVDYFNNGKVTKDFILADVTRYDKRWSTRTYHLVGEPQITIADSGHDVAEAICTFQFTVRNSQKTISGSGQNTLLIANARTNPKIISAKVKILNQRVERK